MALFSCLFRIIRRRPQAYIGLLFNEFISMAVVFAYTTLLYHPRLQILLQGTDMYTEITFPALSLGVLLSTSAPIYYSLTTLYRSRQSQFGVFLLLGIKPRHFLTLLLLETVIVGGCAVIGGTVLGIVLSLGLLFFLGKTFEYMEFPFYFSWTALADSVIKSLLLFIVLAIFVPFFVQRKSPIQLLQSGKRMDDQPDFFPGSLRAIIAVLCFVFLFAICFFLPTDIGWGASVFWMLYACFFLAIVGSHFFYRQSSLYLASFFRWKKNFSWKGIRLLWIGDMVHRLRDNSRFFHKFSISLMVLFIFSGVGVALMQWPVKEIVRMMGGTVPQVESALLYHLGEESTIDSGVEEKLKYMDRILLREGLIRIDISSLIIINEDEKINNEHRLMDDQRREVLQKGNRTTHMRHHQGGLFISLGDYNRMRKASGKTILSLDHDSAAVLCEQKTCLDPEIPMNSIPGKLGVKEVQYWKRMGLIAPPKHVGNVPQWILGDRVYEKALQYPGVQKFLDANYLVPERHMHMSPKLFEVLVKAQSLDEENRFGSWRDQIGDQSSDSFIYSEVVARYRPILLGILYLISLLITGPIAVISAGNMLFFRVYNDIEDRRQQFKNLFRIGFSIYDIQKSFYIQIIFILFLPTLLASFLTFCQIYYGARLLEHWLPMEIEIGNKLFISTGLVIFIWLALQVAVFLPARSRVLHKIRGQ
ncbi:FtsX-like permease family protein [Pasteuria penetrans]|uniref:FtsX-like permease family protein n=1 Tax=Pasteuria penetrans TaxID=86005 RepID=UPI00165CD346|nr:ABC transporter permease [Pasteuria penetrans]